MTDRHGTDLPRGRGREARPPAGPALRSLGSARDLTEGCRRASLAPRRLAPGGDDTPGPRATAAATLAAAGLAALLALAACGSSEGTAAAEAPAERAVPVRSRPPAVEDVVDRVSLAADLLPLRRAVLAAEVPGVVEALRFEEGERVAAGQVLAAIDTRALQQARAEAEAVFRQAEDQQRRAAALFERRAITRDQLVAAETERDVAAARLASAELELEKSTIRAPWGGRIAAQRAEVGDYLVAGQPVAELVAVDRLKVRAPVPAADVPYLRLGAPVQIRVDALAGEVFTGRLVRLGAELDAGARTLDVEAEIDNPEGRLKPGMLARLEVPLRTLERALLVPRTAVVDLGDADAVYVVEGDRARRRMVEQGPAVGERVVLLSGVGAGDRVVVEGAQQVAEGQLVVEAEGS